MLLCITSPNSRLIAIILKKFEWGKSFGTDRRKDGRPAGQPDPMTEDKTSRVDGGRG